LQLQEQLHQTLLTIEQSRKDSEAASKQSAKENADMIANRLKLIDQALTRQREQETETARNSSRFALTVAGLLGGVGLIVMLLTAWFLMRTARQFSDLTALATQPSIGPRPLAGLLSDSQLSLRGSGTIEASGGRLLSALERLEKRIYEIEHAALVPQNPPDAGNGDQKAANGHLDAATAAQVALLLGKAQSLLHLDKPEEALVCFDEALALDRNNTEALVKKGAALEKLKRLEDAVVCYDSALAVDDSMTLAYLYKGGVFNQLERFSEALQCYEKALRTQQKVAVN
jgi:tetratricopeptide (TPR) repeat protein